MMTNSRGLRPRERGVRSCGTGDLLRHFHGLGLPRRGLRQFGGRLLQQLPLGRRPQLLECRDAWDTIRALAHRRAICTVVRMDGATDSPTGVGRTLQQIAATSTNGLLRALGRASGDARTSNAVFLDYLFLYCHLVERIAFAKLEPQRRGPFMDALALSVVADVVRVLDAGPQVQQTEFRI